MSRYLFLTLFTITGLIIGVGIMFAHQTINPFFKEMIYIFTAASSLITGLPLILLDFSEEKLK